LQKKNNLWYGRAMPTVTPTEVDERQAGLLDVSGEKYNVNWVDEKQPLFVPNRPLHFKAHKLQVLLGMLDKQAQNRPTAFNSTNYLNVLNEYTKCVEIIRGGKPDERSNDQPVDASAMGGVGYSGTTPAMGGPATPGMGSTEQADNPLTR
jgi:hypothetical protein